MARRLLIVAASLMLVGAPASAQQPQLAYGLSPSDVEQGFIMAVIDGCANAAETGRTLDQLNPYRIIRDTNRGAALAPRPGYTAWAPGIGVGVVRIDDGPGGCEVIAHGASVQDTFDVLASLLQARGYAAQADGSPGAGEIGRILVREADGRRVRVLLSGRDVGTGAATGFSELSASVTVTAH